MRDVSVPSGAERQGEEPGCGDCGCLLLVIVLVVGGIIGYQIWHQRNGYDSGLVKEQTVTLTSGSDYAFTSSGDLKPASVTAGYGQQLQVDITTWDEAKTSLNK